MFTISDRLYAEIAEKLLEAIGRRSYFSGSVTLCDGDTECKLLTSLVIIRTTAEMPEGECDRIEEIIPVWWELSTAVDGVEILNDFSFGDLKNFLL